MCGAAASPNSAIMTDKTDTTARPEAAAPEPPKTDQRADPAAELRAAAQQAANDVDSQQPADAEPAAEPPEARIAALEAERDAFREKWMRAEAEMANLRARTKREVEDARLYAVQKFASDVAEAAENLRRGLESLPARSDDEPSMVTRLREGFEGVERSFLGMLERHGVTAQEADGATFDPERHQAMAEQESADVPPGSVLKAWSRAWMLNGRLLRPAMVVVARAPTEKSPPEKSE